MRRLSRPVAMGAAVLTAILVAPVLTVPAAATVVPPDVPAAVSADPHDVSLRLSRLVSGLADPVLVTSAHEGRPRLYVVERDGRIRIWTKEKGIAPGAFLDIRGRVNSAGDEQGLLGLAFSPNYAVDRLFWVSYTDSAGGLQISRFKATSPRSVHVSGSLEKKVLRVAHPTYTNHNGGMLAFGREGHLYISTGDGGGGGDPFGNAQDRSTLAGKILRINPYSSCSGRLYCVPPRNPYAAPGGARGAIWLYGLRNPWRFSVDRDTGDLWIGDVGQGRYEEVDRVPYAERGWNMGWSCREAFEVYSASRCISGATYHDPVTAYGRSKGGSVIGGYVYRADRYASLLQGLYVFGDFISGRLWVYGQGTRIHAGDVGAYRLSAFGEGDTGELYATTLDGGLYRVVASAA